MNLEKLQKLFTFSWAQAFSDSNGKSTVMPIAGAYVTFIGGAGFVYGGIIKDANLLSQSIIMTTIGASILIGRKMMNGKPGQLPTMEDDPPAAPPGDNA
jgi:hypothetical protein